MPAPIRFGRYLLLERLAVGGMAEIFLAKVVGEGGFERLCVVKRALPHLSRDPEFIRMFMDEARLAARLHHPGIVQIHELGTCDDDYYIAMEYLAGEDLAAVLVQSRKVGLPIPIGVAARVIASAAVALHAAHTFSDPATGPMRIVHRDVSPSNLFLTFHGDVKVLDFGVARAEGRLASTLAGVTKGKLSYMSPEQAQGLEVDARTDVWALGLCLRELLTGRRLFSGTTAPLERVRHIVHAPIPPPGAERQDVPPELDRITMRALQRTPNARYATAGGFAADLEAFLRTHLQEGDALSPSGYLQRLYGEAHISAKTSPAQACEQRVPHAHSSGTQRLAAPVPPTLQTPAGITQPLPLRATSRSDVLPLRDVTERSDAATALTATATASPLPDPRTPVGPATTDVAATRPTSGRLSPAPQTVRVRRALAVLSIAALLALSLAAGTRLWRPGESMTPAVSERAASGPEARSPSAQVKTADGAGTASALTVTPDQPPPEAHRADDAPVDLVAADALPADVSSASSATEASRPTPARRPRAGSTRSSSSGTLTIRANVPVDAFLGKRRLGPVPVEPVRVPAGRHTLRLVNAERNLSHQSTVHIGSGRATVHEVALGTGTLNVDAIPWAEVWIDGEKLGLTPIAGHVLWEGAHQLRLVGPDGTRKRSVRIRPGGVTVVPGKICARRPPPGDAPTPQVVTADITPDTSSKPS